MMDIIEQLEKKIKIKFKDRKHIEEALTHKSYALSKGEEKFNERMEFLGDSILNTAVTDFLYHRYPNEDEGKLSKLKSQLVSKSSLYKWAQTLKLGAHLKLTENESQANPRLKESILADAMEAVIGAIYLDHGFEKAKDFVIKKFSQAKRIVENDTKSKLQELIQKKFKIPPSYTIIKESGPDHDKTFHSQVHIKKKLLGEGLGKSKKESEQAAAKDALKRIRKDRRIFI